MTSTSNLTVDQQSESQDFTGPRFLRLQQVFSQCLDTIASTVSCDEFLKCFPKKFVEHNREMLIMKYNDFLKIFRKNSHVFYFVIL